MGEFSIYRQCHPSFDKYVHDLVNLQELIWLQVYRCTILTFHYITSKQHCKSISQIQLLSVTSYFLNQSSQ